MRLVAVRLCRALAAFGLLAAVSRALEAQSADRPSAPATSPRSDSGQARLEENARLYTDLRATVKVLGADSAIAPSCTMRVIPGDTSRVAPMPQLQGDRTIDPGMPVLRNRCAPVAVPRAGLLELRHATDSVRVF